MKKTHRVTIKEIAEQTGSSISTVSRVINGERHVNETTRKKILKALEESGYRSDPFALALKTGQTKIVQLIIDTFEGAFINQIMTGLLFTARPMGYRILLSTLEYEEGVNFQEDISDGVIFVAGTVDRVNLEKIKSRIHVPLVCVYSYDEDQNIHSLIPDDFDGAFKAADHLIDRGCRNILFVKGMPGLALSERLKGFQAALEHHGYLKNAAYADAGSWEYSDAYAAVGEYLAAGSSPDGVFASSDHLAVGALKALNDHGLSVPDEVKLIGFDDKHMDRFLHPSLSSIAMPLRELGKTAFDLLLQEIRQHGTGTRGPKGIVKLPCRLIPRNSTL
jgi:DNA-binding LacI/PurR family transcriptional regulator